jgi:hypothetical protein
VVAGTDSGQPGGEHGVAADVQALVADLHDAAHDHVVDERGVEVVALDERLEDLGGEVGAGRLKQLHADGIVERRPYREPGKRTRDEYVLTERGRGLYPVIVALMEWGEGLADDHRSGVELVHRDCGAVLEAQVRCAEGHDVPLEEGGVRLKDEARALKAKRAGLA